MSKLDSPWLFLAALLALIALGWCSAQIPDGYDTKEIARLNRMVDKLQHEKHGQADRQAQALLAIYGKDLAK